MAMVSKLFNLGNTVTVLPTTERRRQGVVFFADEIGLAIMRVRQYHATGWQLDNPTRVEFLPWGNVDTVEDLLESEIPEECRKVFDHARSVVSACSDTFKPKPSR